jgi:hypothetical protein
MLRLSRRVGKKPGSRLTGRKIRLPVLLKLLRHRPEQLLTVCGAVLLRGAFSGIHFDVSTYCAAVGRHPKHYFIAYFRSRPKAALWPSFDPSARKDDTMRLIGKEATCHRALTFWTGQRLFFHHAPPHDCGPCITRMRLCIAIRIADREVAAMLGARRLSHSISINQEVDFSELLES